MSPLPWLHYPVLSFMYSIPSARHSTLLALHAITVTGHHMTRMHSCLSISSQIIAMVKRHYLCPRLLMLFRHRHGLGKTWVSGSSWIGCWPEAGRSPRLRSPDSQIYCKQTISTPMISKSSMHTPRWNFLTTRKVLSMRTTFCNRMVSERHQSILRFLLKSVTQMGMDNVLRLEDFSIGCLLMSSMLFSPERMWNCFILLHSNESGAPQWLVMRNVYLTSSTLQMLGMMHTMKYKSSNLVMGVN